MSCPYSNDLQRLAQSSMAQDSLATEDRDRLLEHVSICAECRASWLEHSLNVELATAPLETAPAQLKARVRNLRLNAELATGPPESAPAQLKARARNPTRRAADRAWPRRRLAALAASLLAVVGLGWWGVERGALNSTWRIDRETTSPLREDPLEVHAPRLASPAQGDVLVDSRLTLSWFEVDGALDYRLTVTDPRGDVVLHDVVNAAPVQSAPRQYRIDRAATRMAAGPDYFWFVTARLADGTEIDSEIRSFRLGDGD